MKNSDINQENGTLAGPLILTPPASNFVAILRPDWLKGSDQTAAPAKTHGWAQTARRRPGSQENSIPVIGRIKRIFQSAVLMIFGSGRRAYWFADTLDPTRDPKSASGDSSWLENLKRPDCYQSGRLHGFTVNHAENIPESNDERIDDTKLC
jgi:hypothetical protein